MDFAVLWVQQNVMEVVLEDVVGLAVVVVVVELELDIAVQL